MADFVFGRCRVFVQEAIGPHEHPGRAEPALQSVLFIKTFLNRMQNTCVGEAFDGQDFRALTLHRKVGAGLDGLAVDVDGTGTAMARFAADVGAG